MNLINAMSISGAGMKVQSDRLKIVSQNIANAESVGVRPGDKPYQRKTISFENYMDREKGAEMVRTKKLGVDNSDFQRRYDPGHPAADAQGYVLFPNVNSMVEMMDMREARRSYEANLNMVESSRAMINQTLNLLR
jgi:flagellar basal-body rod protein FlgC